MKNYSKITFPGSLLESGFSIYLWEITHKNEKYFYVGMTGDNYYPSARSAIHRLSGHFERNRRSTQNQMRLAIQHKEFDLKKTEITMYHWSIAGFEPWGSPLKNFNPSSLGERDRKRYHSYMERRNKILALENFLIKKVEEEVGADKCLNKTQKSPEDTDTCFDSIVQEVINILRTS